MRNCCDAVVCFHPVSIHLQAVRSPSYCANADGSSAIAALSVLPILPLLPHSQSSATLHSRLTSLLSPLIWTHCGGMPMGSVSVWFHSPSVPHFARSMLSFPPPRLALYISLHRCVVSVSPCSFLCSDSVLASSWCPCCYWLLEARLLLLSTTTGDALRSKQFIHSVRDPLCEWIGAEWYSNHHLLLRYSVSLHFVSVGSSLAMGGNWPVLLQYFIKQCDTVALEHFRKGEWGHWANCFSTVVECLF